MWADYRFRNLQIDDKSREDEEEKAGTPDGKAEASTPTGKRKDKKEKLSSSKEDKDKNRRTSAGKSKQVGRRGSTVMTTPPTGGAQTPGSEIDGQRWDNLLRL